MNDCRTHLDLEQARRQGLHFFASPRVIWRTATHSSSSFLSSCTNEGSPVAASTCERTKSDTLREPTSELAAFNRSNSSSVSRNTMLWLLGFIGSRLFPYPENALPP